MRSATIKELAYVIQEAKKAHLPSPIVFLGAGASKTGGIPLASEIVQDILRDYSDSPRITKLAESEQSYPKLMECLTPHQRNKLLKGYIDKAKINVTHIYLAQLMEHDYADYVLTVNFDNLMLRALALFNAFYPTYDMAILTDLTTTTFKPQSVVYLHGQHHGLWLLNTQEEMAKVNTEIPRIFDGIKNERPWIFIGYSGEDPIFEHIKQLGRFDNGLYWVGYYDQKPSETVRKQLLDKPNTNAHCIEGYDADSFMLTLNNELGLPQPGIIDKPFSSLELILSNIEDIDDKEHFKGVKQRLEIAKRHVKTAIQGFEQGDFETAKNITETVTIDNLKKNIIDVLASGEFDMQKIENYRQAAEHAQNREVDNLLAYVFNNWGIHLGRQAEEKTREISEKLYTQAFEEFQLSLSLKPDNYQSLYNWALCLESLAQTKPNDKYRLYSQANDKYQQVISIDPDNYDALSNWGINLIDMAETKPKEEVNNLHKLAISKFNQAADAGSDYYYFACFFVSRLDKENALIFLRKSLANQEITTDLVVNDEDWKAYLQDHDFLELIKRYS